MSAAIKFRLAVVAGLAGITSMTAMGASPLAPVTAAAEDGLGTCGQRGGDDNQAADCKDKDGKTIVRKFNDDNFEFVAGVGLVVKADLTAGPQHISVGGPTNMTGVFASSIDRSFFGQTETWVESRPMSAGIEAEICIAEMYSSAKLGDRVAHGNAVKRCTGPDSAPAKVMTADTDAPITIPTKVTFNTTKIPGPSFDTKGGKPDHIHDAGFGTINGVAFQQYNPEKHGTFGPILVEITTDDGKFKAFAPLDLSSVASNAFTYNPDPSNASATKTTAPSESADFNKIVEVTPALCDWPIVNAVIRLDGRVTQPGMATDVPGHRPLIRDCDVTTANFNQVAASDNSGEILEVGVWTAQMEKRGTYDQIVAIQRRSIQWGSPIANAGTPFAAPGI